MKNSSTEQQPFQLIPTHSNRFANWLTIPLLALGLFLVGCQPPRDPLIDMVDARSSTIKIDDIQRALSLVKSTQAYDIKEFEDRTSGDLNRWLSKIVIQQKQEDNWMLNPAVEKLAEPFQQRGLPVVEGLKDKGYLITDSHFLRQADWCSTIVERVLSVENPLAFEFLRLAAGTPESVGDPNQDFLNYIKTLHPEVAESDAQSLADSVRIFDWVVRNFQLDPETTFTPDEIPDQVLVDSASGDAWFDGVRGVGYNRTPIELLTYGRGDYVERAKLFIKLLEHHDLDAAMLAIGDKPWVVGVKIGNELYLFDTRLGLAIPQGRPGTVATLNQLRANPEWLSGLDLTLAESIDGDNKYGVTSDQLASLKALIYVSPESVSHRMAYLEQRMTGANRMRLVQDTDRLIKVFTGFEGIEPALWDVEFKNAAFRYALRDALIRARTEDVLQQRLQWYYENENYVDNFPAYRTARNMFVHGEFTSPRNSDETNAVENFYLLMYTDKQIDNLATNTNLQLRLGILKSSGQSPAQFQDSIRGYQNLMRLVRRDAGLFLAESHFDNGNVGTAGNWLDRISTSGESERWHSGIEYLRGRSLESRLEFEKAIAEYKKSESAQRHGNLLRMRYLIQLTAKG